MDNDLDPIVVKVQYSYEEYKEFIAFSLFKGKHYPLGKWINLIGYPVLIALVTGLILVMGFDLVLVIGDTVLVLLYVFCLFMINYIPWKNHKDSSKLLGSDTTYSFRSNDFLINQSGNLISGDSMINYQAIYKVYETKSMFYIFFRPGVAFLINKKGIVGREPKDLRLLLQSKLPRKKYIICFKE